MSKEKSVVDYPNSIETRVALLERSIDDIRDTMKEMKSEGRVQFRWTMVLITGLYATIIGSLWTIIAKFVH